MSDARPAIALIPARGGSKGIKDKNIVPLAGKPLIQYSIDAAKASSVIGRIVVSSDSPRILDVARSLGAEALRRPDELATDIASSDAVIAHAIDALKLSREPEAPIVLLQPTSPLRTPVQIADALALWRQGRHRCVMGVHEPAEHPAKAFKLGENGLLTGLYGPDAPFMARQLLPKAYMANGAIYIFSVGAFTETDGIPRKDIFPFLMDARTSVDIDTLEQLATAERYLKGS